MVASEARFRGAANRRPTRRSQRQVAPAALPSEAEVLRAVRSLYSDELRPYGRLIRKRLAEQLGPRGNQLQFCTDPQLRTVCEISASLRVEHEEQGDGITGEWSALLVNGSPTFVDVYSEVDVYPDEVWSAAEVHFKAAGGQLVLPRGRYASARALLAQRLPFLAGYTLGRVCHFIQLALSQRKILGYVDGAIVPYAHSMSMVKARCAQQKRPLPSGDAAAPVAADWASARATLREILALRGDSPLPLSNIKRLFRSLYNLELSETALGHTTLTELLNDPHFHDICEVQLQGRYHVAVSRQPALAADSEAPKVAADCKEVEKDDPTLLLPGMQNPVNKQLLRQQSPPPVRHTFIHFQDAPCHEPSSLGASRRSCSWPQVGTCAERPMLLDDECQKGAKTMKACFSNREPLSFFPDEQLDLEGPNRTDGLVKNNPEASPLMTPSPLYTAKEASESLPLRPNAWEATCLALGMEPIEQGRAGRRGSKCAQEKVSLQAQAESNSEDTESQEEDYSRQYSARAETPEREELCRWRWLPPTSSLSRPVGSHVSRESLIKQQPQQQKPASSCASGRMRPKTILGTATSTGTLPARAPTAGVLPMDIPMALSARLPPVASHSALPMDVSGARLASVTSHGTLPVDIPGTHVPQISSHTALRSDTPRARGIRWLLPAAMAACPSASFVAASNPGVTFGTMPAGVVSASAEGWARHVPPPQQQLHQPHTTSHGIYATRVFGLACMI
jgi:hypothetical protein